MNILVVENRPAQLTATTAMLNALGHSVTATDASNTAWELLTTGLHQAVIVNWDMPCVSGPSLCQRIRHQKFDHYIYVIILTSRSDQTSLIEGIDAGADDFLSKTPDCYQLAIRLRTAQRFLDMEHRLTRKHWDLATAHNTIRTDLEKAARTQRALLPKPIYSETLRAWWTYRPAIFCGGDTFNFFSPLPDIWFFHSIDVSGHGLSAAMLSIHLQAHINSMSHSLYGGDITLARLAEIPAAFAHNMNKLVAATDSDHYLTMLFGIIDLRNCVIHYVQAGHPHPYLYRDKLDTLQAIDSNGYPIGLLSDVDWKTEQMLFEPGDRLVVYSDGLIENAELQAVPGSDSLSDKTPLCLPEQKLNTTNSIYGASRADKLQEMFSYLCTSTNDDDLNQKVAHCIGDRSNNNMTDDINVLIFEYQRAA